MSFLRRARKSMTDALAKSLSHTEHTNGLSRESIAVPVRFETYATDVIGNRLTGPVVSG